MLSRIRSRLSVPHPGNSEANGCVREQPTGAHPPNARVTAFSRTGLARASIPTDPPDGPEQRKKPHPDDDVRGRLSRGDAGLAFFIRACRRSKSTSRLFDSFSPGLPEPLSMVACVAFGVRSIRSVLGRRRGLQDGWAGNWPRPASSDLDLVLLVLFSGNLSR